MKVLRDKSSLTRTRFPKIGNEIIALAGLTTLVIMPARTIDPFSPPKFAIVVSGVSYLGLRYRKMIQRELAHRNILFAFTFLLAIYTIVFIANSYSISERLFGIQGRNFGLITLVAFTLLGFYSFQATRSNLLSPSCVLNGLAITNVSVCSVLFMQETGFIFSDYSVTFPSTLGNPNFTSAFIGISFLGILNWMFQNKDRPFLVLIGTFLSGCSLYIILVSQSIQGIVAIVISLLAIALMMVFKYFSKFQVIIFCTFLGVSSLLVLLGFLKYGPLGELLNQQTLRNRLIYWGIALRMVFDSPIFGKGYDTYLDHYRIFVKQKDFEVLGGPVISDSPHNIFLDLFVSGGFFLALPILILITFTLIRGFNCIQKDLKSKNLEMVNASLYAIFFAVIAICLISPFTIGLFVWLPIIMGALLGLSTNGSVNQETNLLKIKRSFSYGAATFLWVGIVSCNFVVAALPVAKEVRLRTAAQEGSFVKLEKVALDWPFSGPRAIAIAQGFLDTANRLDAENPDQDPGAQSKLLRQKGLEIALSTVEINKAEITGWKFLLENSPNLATKEKARQRLQELYPIDPDRILSP